MSEEFDRKSFSFFESFAIAAQELTDKQRLTFYDAIINYALYGQKPDLKGAPKAMFVLCEPVLNKGITQYKNAKNGGRENKSQTKANCEPKKANEEPNESQSKLISLEDKDIGVGVGIKDMDMECVEEDGSAVDGNTSDTPEKPDTVAVIKEAALLGSTMTASEARRFLEFNEALGWKVEWKYALKRWIQQEQQKPRGKPKLKNDVSERHVYDMEEMRKRAKL